MTEADARRKAEAAEEAALELANVDDEVRSNALRAAAEEIRSREDEILDANAEDVAEAEKLLEEGEYTQALVDRLKLDSEKVEGIASMVESVAAQTDPVGETLESRELDSGLELYRVSAPIGVVGSVFESRPDALPQISSLALKSANACVLKGGSEARESNRVLYSCIRSAADDVAPGWLQLVEEREEVDALLEMDEHVDLLMPRGSTEFVRYIQENTRIPVLGHTEGVCHVYVDRNADLDMAVEVAVDAKVQYPAACNAMETLLIHDDVAADYLPQAVEALEDEDVELRGDDRVRDHVDVPPVRDDDWITEYGDLELSMAVVDGLDEAIDHVNTYGSKHTDSILTESDSRARSFMEEVDSASVFHDASTRFSDGYRYGLGAEVGISTGKTHARGPVGVRGLTTYKWYIEGSGQCVDDYSGDDAREFTHQEFDGDW